MTADTTRDLRIATSLPPHHADTCPAWDYWPCTCGAEPAPCVLLSDATAATAAITAKEAEIEALRVDAERYRWLREQGTLVGVHRHRHFETVYALIDDLGAEHVDAAIDAAMQSREGAEDAQRAPAPLLLNTAPEHIWLDVGPDCDDSMHFRELYTAEDGMTWSEDNASGSGIKYVRAGLDGVLPRQEDS